jgi:hypothetical protein
MTPTVTCLGYSFAHSQWIGLGPLMRSDTGTSFGVTLELYFDILLIHYPLRLSTGPINGLNSTPEQRKQVLARFERSYDALQAHWEKSSARKLVVPMISPPDDSAPAEAAKEPQ